MAAAEENHAEHDQMQLATEIVRFFHIDVATASKSPVRTIDDFSKSKPGWYESLDLGEVFRVCSALEKEGYLVSALSDSRHPVLGRAFVAPNFEERRATYGEYEFAAHGFYRVREHFQSSIMPVIVENKMDRQTSEQCRLRVRSGLAHRPVR